MTDIIAPIQCRPWLKDELARVDREITEMQREIGILQEGLDDLEIERSDLIDQLERLDQLYDSFPRDGRVVVDEEEGD
jgi:chromosome segregation ATPase